MVDGELLVDAHRLVREDGREIVTAARAAATNLISRAGI
jgi:hypothetical protein